MATVEALVQQAAQRWASLEARVVVDQRAPRRAGCHWRPGAARPQAARHARGDAGQTIDELLPIPREGDDTTAVVIGYELEKQSVEFGYPVIVWEATERVVVVLRGEPL